MWLLHRTTGMQNRTASSKGEDSSTQLFSSFYVNMCTSNPQSRLHWWRTSQLNFFLTNNVELSFMVYKILSHTSHSILTATLWGGHGGHSIPILPMDKLRLREVGNQSKITQLLSKRTSTQSGSLLPHSPHFFAQTLWKRILVLSSKPKWHSVHAQPGQSPWGKGQLIKLIAMVQSGMEWGFLLIPKNASLSARQCRSLGFPGHS